MASNSPLFGTLFAELPTEWELVPFPSAVDFQEGPGIMAREFHESGVPLIRVTNLVNGSVSLQGCNYLDPEKVQQKWNHFRLSSGDLLVSSSGTLGRVAVVGQDQSGIIHYTGIIRMRPAEANIDPGFIRYFVTSPLFQEQALALSTGSVLQHFGPSHLKKMTFPLPRLDEQRAIASVLGSFDDKIELNRCMNETLEEMARALFKSWFVDFDPVRAKMEGRQPAGMDEEMAALIPDSFEDSALGKIPKGWAVESLDHVARFLNGLALQKYPPKGDDYLPAIKIAELRKGVTASSGRASTAIPPQYIVEDGDVLFSWSGSLEVQLWTGGRGALNQHLFKVSSERYPKWFYYSWIKQHLPEFRMIAADKATTMGHIKRHHLTDALTVVPPLPTLETMSATVEPIVSTMLNNHLESRTLAAVRDALLPKLLSGEVRVGEAEEIVEEVG